MKTTPSAALKELRDYIATYFECSDDTPRVHELLDMLDAAIAPTPTPTSPVPTPPALLAMPDNRAREMFGCTEQAINGVLAGKEPRDIAMYAMGTLSNAQALIYHDGDEPFAWSVRRGDANTIRQLMNIAKYAIDKAVPR